MPSDTYASVVLGVFDGNGARYETEGKEAGRKETGGKEPGGEKQTAAGKVASCTVKN